MPRRERRIQTTHLSVRVDERLIPDLMVLVRAGTVANKADAVERGLKLLLAMNAETLTAAKAREAADADALALALAAG